MKTKANTMTYLIVDDEDLARTELSRQISGLVSSFLPVEAANVTQARSILLSQRVDGVFLDLEMPGVHGMSFIPEIRAMRIPVVITTAHDRFAVDAFDGDAADYLLKPIEPSRLARALARMRKDENHHGDSLIVLGDQSHCWPLHPEEIIMVESDGSYVRIHVKDRKPIHLTKSLKEIELLLPDHQFVRVNRSQIVRLHCLKLIRRREGGGFSAELDSLGPIEFSRRQAQAFRQRHGF